MTFRCSEIVAAALRSHRGMEKLGTYAVQLIVVEVRLRHSLP